MPRNLPSERSWHCLEQRGARTAPCSLTADRLPERLRDDRLDNREDILKAVTEFLVQQELLALGGLQFIVRSGMLGDKFAVASEGRPQFRGEPCQTKGDDKKEETTGPLRSR